MLGVWRVWRSHSDVDWRFNAGHRRRVAGSLRLEGGLDSRAGGDTGGAGEARHGGHRAGRAGIGGREAGVAELGREGGGGQGGGGHHGGGQGV